MTDLSAFAQYYKLADMLIAQASKEQLAECARLLALNLAHYQTKYGDLPLDEMHAMTSASGPNDGQSELLALGMENLVGILGTVCSGMDASRH
jgi:hypothetical protein